MTRSAALVTLALTLPAQAAPRFIGPWFVDVTLNTATETTSLTAGQNTTAMGITLTCFDRHLTLGVWKPGSGLRLVVPSKALVSVQVDAQDPIIVKGYATAPNLAEFYTNVEPIMRQMLAGERVAVTLTDGDGNTRSENFPLANTAQAFSGLTRYCPL